MSTKSKGKETGTLQQTGEGKPDHKESRPCGLFLLAIKDACQAEEVDERKKSVIATIETKDKVLKNQGDGSGNC